MFVKLVLDNFQKHKHLEVSFEEINSIVGATDAGKSVIFRALYWLCFNRPGGNQFIRWGATRCSVTVHLSNGTVITRRKSKTENQYELNGKLYVSFGSKVPDDITKALGVCNVNFQQQHDSPFWFSLSPGEVSKQLNEIVNLDIIDHSLSSINTSLRETKSEMKWVDERITEAKAKVNRLKNVPTIQKLFTELQKIESVLETTACNGTELYKHLELIEKLESGWKRYKKVNSLPVPDNTPLLGLQEPIMLLTALINTIKELEDERPFDSTVILTMMKELDRCSAEYKEVESSLTILFKITRSCKLLEERQCQERRQSKVKETKLNKMIGSCCPLCGNGM